MPDPMTAFYEGPPRAEGVEVITSVQRRRRWSTEEKVRIVEETYLPGNSVSLVARRHGIAGNQSGGLMAQGALTRPARWRKRTASEPARQNAKAAKRAKPRWSIPQTGL